MMVSLAVPLAVFSLPLLAVAIPNGGLGKRGGSGGSGGSGGGSTCDTGPIQCCDSTTTAGSEEGSKLLGIIGTTVQNADVVLGVTCSPVSDAGTGDACSGETVCCQDNSYGGLVSIGCVPVNV